MLDKVLLREVLSLVDARGVDFKVFESLLMINYLLGRKFVYAIELLEHVGLRVKHYEVNLQVAQFGQLVGFFDQYLLAFAFHFLNASLLALDACHLSFLSRLFTI